MIVRALDADHDWTFGKGFNDYLSGRYAIGQNIQTRLMSFLGDCFFSLDSGIDWFNLLGSKNEVALNLAISSVILNTDGVTSIVEISSRLDENRNFRVEYDVTVAVGPNSNPLIQGKIILTEGGDILTTEGGDALSTET